MFEAIKKYKTIQEILKKENYAGSILLQSYYFNTAWY